MTDFACRRCGSTDVHVDERDDPDKPYGIRCFVCKAYTWPPKSENETKRRDHNSRWRKIWRQQASEFTCTWCRVRASQTRCNFDVDHIIPLEAGGKDEWENTMVLCRNCHTVRHAMQAAVQHLNGRSARDHSVA